jgi:HSP20 family protein
MADDMDRIFQDFGFARGLGLSSEFDRDLWRGGAGRELAVWSPQLDAFRRGDNYVIRADLPGLKKDDVKVEVQDGVLSISGERRVEHDETKDDVYRSERSYGRFFRSVSLPENVNAEDCNATFNDGVLEVSFAAPKQADKKAKQVQIR